MVWFTAHRPQLRLAALFRLAGHVRLAGGIKKQQEEAICITPAGLHWRTGAFLAGWSVHNIDAMQAA